MLVDRLFFKTQPSGFFAIFLTQIFSTISFAVLYATLVLYMKMSLRMSSHDANLVTGVYFACNFALHLLSGYLGGRFFSYRGLVIIGVVFQFMGSLILMHESIALLYDGLAFMLVGTGSLVTCLNMLLSQLYDAPDVDKRQSGFLWNYSGMNFGFLIGFTLAGYFQLHVDYRLLFLITAVMNVIAIIVLSFQWKAMADKKTIFSQVTVGEQKKRMFVGILFLIILIPLLTFLLAHTKLTDDLILVIGAIVALFLLSIALRSKKEVRHKMFAFLVLLLSAQIFWIVYQLAPMGLTFFAKNNVNREVLGFLIAPGWIQNINSLTIIIGSPLLGILFSSLVRLKQKGYLLPLQYTLGLFLSGVGLLLLPIGIHFSTLGYTAFIWLFFNYVLQAVAELLISPIGYSMVGQLVPTRWQSICMGSILLNSGVAAVLASYFSNIALGSTSLNNPLITNPSYSHMFSVLGLATLTIAFFMLLLVKQLKHWIS